MPPEPTTNPDWGAIRDRTISWHDPLRSAARGAELDGIDYLNAMIAGEIPPPPIAATLGFALVSVEPGRAVFTCEPDESVYNPIGMVHGGLVCTLLDSAMGCAVQTTLPLGRGYTSIDISVSFVRPIRFDSGLLTATGTVRKPGSRVAFAEAVVTDSEGRELATGTSSLLVFPQPTRGEA